jgi:hypothetical protein
MGLAYYIGLQNANLTSLTSGTEQKSDNSADMSADESAGVADEALVEEKSFDPVSVAVKRELGKFNDELFHLEWKETRSPEDMSVRSATPAVLKKINLQSKMVTVAENIVAGENKSIDSLSNVTTDNKSVILKLNCLNGDKAPDCTVEKTFLVLNLESGRAMNITAILSSVQQRSKLPVCNYIPTDNFVQNNLLFVCEDAESLQSLYKYNVSTLAVTEVQKLKETENFVCKDPEAAADAKPEYLSGYEKESLLIEVCSKEDPAKNLRTITVKDI